MFLDARPQVGQTKPLVRRPESLMQRASAAGAAAPAASHVLMQFLPSGACFVLDLEGALILGREPASMPRFLDLTELNAHRHGVSRFHAMIEREDGRLILTDLKSTNGTFVNGRRLRAQCKYALSDGDHIVLGTLHALVFLHEVPQPG